MFKKLRKIRKSLGFTLIELVVAIGVLLILGTSVSALILVHIQDSRLAAITSDISDIAVAVRSAAVRSGGTLTDRNADGNFLDEIVDDHFLDKKPVSIPGGEWILKRTISSSGQTNYYIDVVCTDQVCKETFRQLDKRIDDGNGSTTGLVQWN